MLDDAVERRAGARRPPHRVVRAAIERQFQRSLHGAAGAAAEDRRIAEAASPRAGAWRRPGRAREGLVAAERVARNRRPLGGPRRGAERAPGSHRPCSRRGEPRDGLHGGRLAQALYLGPHAGRRAIAAASELRGEAATSRAGSCARDDPRRALRHGGPDRGGRAPLRGLGRGLRAAGSAVQPSPPARTWGRTSRRELRRAGGGGRRAASRLRNVEAMGERGMRSRARRRCSRDVLAQLGRDEEAELQPRQRRGGVRRGRSGACRWRGAGRAPGANPRRGTTRRTPRSSSPARR